MFIITPATAGQNQGRMVNVRTRRGISLTEVLIAMGILTVGLLGVASVFPVGSFFMQKGEIADRASAIAQAAFNEAQTRGYLNPENWIAWEDGVTGASLPIGVQTNTFNRPVAQMMRAQRAYQLANDMSIVARNRQTSLEFGSVFAIDPFGMSSVALTDPSRTVHMRDPQPARPRPGSVFPCANVWTNGIPTNVNPNYPWYAWSDSDNLGPRWPVRRMTLKEPSVLAPFYQPMRPSTAQKRFASRDDLTLDLPTAQNKPAIQPWRLARLDNSTGANDPVARLSRGNYSWMITVSPTTVEARDALATDPSPHMYEVSVVVFHRRMLSTVSPTSADELNANMDLLRRGERGTSARIVSTGLNGGEVLLTRNPYVTTSVLEPEESPFQNLKVGNWIMLCGPHPNSTDERPMMTARWYRVLSIEGKNEKLDPNGQPTTTDQPERRLVSLRGPQWPWQPAANLTDSHLSNALYVCIPTGAVAVHSKTIRLEGNSVHNGGVSGLTSR